METMDSKRMDLVARSVDLFKVLCSDSLATGAVQATVQWLCSSGVGREQLKSTVRFAQAIKASPNKHGEVVFQAIADQISNRSTIQSVKLFIPTQLGHLVMEDPRLCWMATTEAVLLRHASVPKVSSVLKDLFIAHTELTEDPMADFAWRLTDLAVDKIVESIAINSVNIEEGIVNTPGLPQVEVMPEALRSLPTHILHSKVLARAMAEIQLSRSNSTLVAMAYYATDLVGWIYYHWNGILEVWVSNEQIFHEQLGDSSRTIQIFVINSNCRRDCTAAHDPGQINICELHQNQESKRWSETTSFESRTHDSWEHAGAYRLKLYDIRNPYGLSTLQLSRVEQQRARTCAQSIVMTIMNQRVRATSSTIALLADQDSETTVKWWTRAFPSLCQENLTDKKNAANYRQLYEQEEHLLSPRDSLLASETSHVDVGDVLERYGELKDIMDTASQRCVCGCQKGQYNFRPGCLQSVILAEAVMLIGHALAQAAGATSVSNISPRDAYSAPTIDATIRILDSLANQGVILWGDWFRLAATVITGISDESRVCNALDESGDIIGCTFGPMTLFPSWFDFETKISAQGSWGVNVLLGVPENLMHDRGFYKPHVTNKARLSNTPPPLISVGEVQHEATASDPSAPLSIQTAVLGSEKSFHILMTLIKVDRAMRCLNPHDIYLSQVHAHKPTCNHESQQQPVSVHGWKLAEVLRNWNGSVAESSPGAHVALVSDSPLERRIAAALAGETCVLQTAECCFGCAVDMAVSKKALLIPFSRARKRMLRSA